MTADSERGAHLGVCRLLCGLKEEKRKNERKEKKKAVQLIISCDHMCSSYSVQQNTEEETGNMFTLKLQLILCHRGRAARSEQ